MAAEVTLWNKIKSLAGATGWSLIPDLIAALSGANVVVPVASKAERDGLTPPLGKYAGMVVARTDLSGVPLDVYDGIQWIPGIISTIWTNPSNPVTTAGGGPGTLTLDTVNSHNPEFITSPGAGQIQVVLAGVYSITWHANSLAGTSGYMSVKNAPGTGTYVLDNYGPSGEQSVSIPNLYLAAGAVVTFVMGPSANVTIGSTIRVTKVS